MRTINIDAEASSKAPACADSFAKGMLHFSEIFSRIGFRRWTCSSTMWDIEPES